MNGPVDPLLNVTLPGMAALGQAAEPAIAPVDSANLKPLTLATSEPALYFAEQQKLTAGKTVMQRLRGTGAVAATSLLAASLLLSACSSDEDDCIISSPAASGSGSSSYASSYVLPTPNPASIPVTPGSAQFTSGQSSAANQTYCRSRRTGGYYWYSGTRYYGSSSS